MGKKNLKFYDYLSGTIVVLMITLTMLLVGARLLGLQVFTVLSASMEPKYMTGSLIYVAKCDPYELQPGDDITYLASESTVVTHRIVGIVPDEEDPSVIRFRTKGIANETEDHLLVHYKNVVGKPVFCIPYLGYLSSYVQSPPGIYFAIAVCVLLLLLVFLPDLMVDDKEAQGAKKTFFGKKKDVPVVIQQLPAELEGQLSWDDWLALGIEAPQLQSKKIPAVAKESTLKPVARKEKQESAPPPKKATQKDSKKAAAVQSLRKKQITPAISRRQEKELISDDSQFSQFLAQLKQELDGE